MLVNFGGNNSVLSIELASPVPGYKSKALVIGVLGPSAVGTKLYFVDSMMTSLAATELVGECSAAVPFHVCKLVLS